MLTLVTGADQPYGRCLVQLLLSLERHGADRLHRTLAWDLGLDRQTRLRLERRFPWCGFRDFDFSRHPPHVAMAERSYAWKPAIVAEAVAETGDAVLWLDSATIVKGSLAGVEAEIRALGVFALAGQTALPGRCHPATLAALEAPPEILDQAERAAGIVGFDPAHPVAGRILADWRAWSLRPEVIVPRPYFDGHRPEQSILSILLHAAAWRGEVRLTPGEIDISSLDPIRSMSSRNKVAPWVPTWADGVVRLHYWAAKAIDRVGLRLEDWFKRRVWGLNRWRTEHFSVFVADPADRRRVRLQAPGWSYLADPFLIRHQGGDWLFAEQFLYAENRGRLVCAPLGRDLRPGPFRIVRDGPGHASFPCPVDIDGRLHMVPETGGRLVCDLLVCESFPDRWRLARRLLHGLDAADTVLFEHDGLWWLVTSVRQRPEAAARRLEIHWTDHPLSGTWRPHPVNAAGLYADQPHGSFRNAGPPIRANGRLFRPVQASRSHYGEGLALMEITRLTPDAFAETPVAGGLLAELGLPEGVSPHHLCRANGLLTWDVRDRTG